jgi:hypothetical protein
MRASDEDRQRTIDELRRHCAAGRIDVDEYAARIERALSAATLAELDQIRADLPMLRIAEPGGHGVWAGATKAPVPRLRRLAAPDTEDEVRRRPRADERLAAAAVAAVTVVVLLAAVLIGLVAEWTWALVLLAGWAAGMIQGRLGRPRRSD